MRDWMVEERKKTNMTQAQIAKQLGISEAYYSYIESGERQKKMDITLVVKLSEIFGIPMDKIAALEMHN